MIRLRLDDANWLVRWGDGARRFGMYVESACPLVDP